MKLRISKPLYDIYTICLLWHLTYRLRIPSLHIKRSTNNYHNYIWQVRENLRETWDR